MYMEPMVFGFNAKSYNEALKQMQEWLNKQTGNSKGIKVEVKDNKTIVTLDDGRVGVARCNPCDEFDVVTGIRVALDDIERKSRKLSDLELRMVKMAQELGAVTLEVWRYDDEPATINFYDKDMCRVMTIDSDKAFTWVDCDMEISIEKLLKERG